MTLPKIDTEGAPIPQADGAVNDYVNKEAATSEYFDPNRTVFFINGMLNSGEDHATAALALSWVQMCKVRGIYNKSVSGWRDFVQCIGDKNQFDGPVSFTANHAVGLRTFFAGETSVHAAREALGRNPAQVSAFDELRKPAQRHLEIFAHSQGNLILSNALQAILAVEGPSGVAGRVVNTFGSPTVNWPPGIVKYEHGFTFDPVSWLAGFDSTWTISKVGMPANSNNPITHAFLQYLDLDPAFVVNRYRWGGWGMTFRLDTEGLAKCLINMGGNFRRVKMIFDYIADAHSFYSDDVALAYVGLIEKRPALLTMFKRDAALKDLLVGLLDAGWVTADEKKAIVFLRGL